MNRNSLQAYSFLGFTLLLLLTLTACIPASSVQGSPTASSTAQTRPPEVTHTLPPPNTPTPEGIVYESREYGFRLQIPAGYRIEELHRRSGILLSIGFAASGKEYTDQYGYPLGLAVYEKPADVSLLDWFSTHIGGLTESGQPTSEEAFFYDPILQNQDDFKGDKALQYLSGDRPVPVETLVDRGDWAIGIYYLQDYPDDYESVYEQMLTSLEFFAPIGGQIAAATQPQPTPTPTVCLDVAAEPRALPPRTTPLEVRFNSDGNIWVWEEESGVAEQISDTGDAQQFSFSPDGQVIAIERRIGNLDDQDYTDDYKVELWAIERDGSNLRQSVSVEQFDTFIPEHEEAWVANLPSWYYWMPGTHRLTFGVFPRINLLGADSSIAGYWQVDADTLELKPTQQPAETKLVPGLLSPDGRLRALFDGNTLSLVNADGTNLREDVFTFLTFPAEEGGGFYGPDILWANDSQSLLAITFTSDDLYSDQSTFATWRVPVDGSAAQLLHTFAGLPFETHLSPNQQYLAYLKRTGPLSNKLELHLAMFDGSKDVLYTTLYLAEYLNWHPDSVHFVYDQSEMPIPLLGSVCGGSMHLLDTADTPATEIRWVDTTRFLFVKGSLDPFAAPRELRLGHIDEPSILIGPYNGDYASYRFNIEDAALGRGE